MRDEWKRGGLKSIQGECSPLIWKSSEEKRVQTLRMEYDRRYKRDISRGFFYLFFVGGCLNTICEIILNPFLGCSRSEICRIPKAVRNAYHVRMKSGGMNLIRKKKGESINGFSALVAMHVQFIYCINVLKSCINR